MANTSHDRTDFSFYKTFTNPEEGYSEDVLIFTPFDLFMAVAIEFIYNDYGVKIDGTDTDVWNLFCTSNFFEELYDDQEFVEMLIGTYEYSHYYDEDYEEWFDTKPWED